MVCFMMPHLGSFANRIFNKLDIATMMLFAPFLTGFSFLFLGVKHATFGAGKSFIFLFDHQRSPCSTCKQYCSMCLSIRAKIFVMDF